MNRFPVQIALVVLILAILGAFLHPLALVLSLAPFDSHGVHAMLQAARELIADLLGWGVLATLLTMAVLVTWERVLERKNHATVANWFGNSETDLPPSVHPKAVVAITGYNDALATAQAVRDFAQQPGVIEVIVVDNNSSDNTAELARAAGATVVAEPRQGYGFACMRALTEALKVTEADVIILTEGDGTFVAGDTAKFLAYIENSELVVGNRVVRGLVAKDSQMDYFFTWGNMAVAMLLRLRFWDGRFLGPAGLSDVGCTFRAIRRHALQRILPDLHVGGNHFSPHMLLVALAHGVSVVEIPIRFRRRVGDSKGASRSMWAGLKVGLAMILYIVSFTPKTLRPKPSVIVERDGVIIRPLQTADPSSPSMEFAPGAAAALAALSRGGHRVVVVGDRAKNGIGSLTLHQARALETRIAVEVERRGGRIDAFVACTHGSGTGCACRQPRPQLVLRAVGGDTEQLAQAVVVSDRPSFLAASANLGCHVLLVEVGGINGSSNGTDKVNDLVGAAQFVLGDGFRSESAHSRPVAEGSSLVKVQDLDLG